MQQTARVTSGRNHQRKCLIVEDSDFDSTKLTRVIENSRHNLRVEVAATLHQARVALARGQTELILLDNNLPDGIGANFALELSRDTRFAEIPIILISDWPSPFMWEKAQSAGVSYVISKTEFDTRYVHAALQKVQKRHRRMTGLTSSVGQKNPATRAG